MTNTDRAALALSTKPNGVSIATDETGAVLGRITPLAGGRFRAARKWGAEGDWRKVSQGFRTVDGALAWISRGHRTQDEANAAARVHGL